MKAWALALQQVPTANATWAGDSILYHKHSDVAVAVAVPGGLFTPVVKACETKSLRQISEEVKDLADPRHAPRSWRRTNTRAARPRSPISACSASSTSPRSSTRRTAPSSRSAPARSGSIADKGQIKIGNFMTVTLTCDHRSVDGALGRRTARRRSRG